MAALQSSKLLPTTRANTSASSRDSPLVFRSPRIRQRSCIRSGRPSAARSAIRSEHNLSGGEQPLSGKLIAFTAPAPYDSVLRSHLEAAGAEALHVPVIETVLSDETAQKDLQRFVDWANASAMEQIPWAKANSRARHWETKLGFLSSAQGRMSLAGRQQALHTSEGFHSEWHRDESASRPKAPQLAGIVFSSRNAIQALARALEPRERRPESTEQPGHQAPVQDGRGTAQAADLRLGEGGSSSESVMRKAGLQKEQGQRGESSAGTSRPETAAGDPTAGNQGTAAVRNNPPAGYHPLAPLLSSLSTDRPPLFLAAMGRDAQLLPSLGPLYEHPCVRIITAVSPATPQEMIELLGQGDGRAVAAVVPRFCGLTEPPVVPDMVRQLREGGWLPLRVNGYITRNVVPPENLLNIVFRRGLTAQAGGGQAVAQQRWPGKRKRVEKATKKQAANAGHSGAQAVIFSSRAEAEGLLRACDESGVEAQQLLLSEGGNSMGAVTVAAHGPVTARGLEELGVRVDVVSKNCSTLKGVVEALEVTYRAKEKVEDMCGDSLVSK